MMKILERNGTRLAYDETGSGEPPLVFIHGIACNRSYFSPQLEHFRRSHRVIATDLRAHGESSMPNGSLLSLNDMADDIAWLCGKVGLQRPVLVGHSMGGNVALEITRRHPGVARAIALLDSAVVMPPELHAVIHQTLRALCASPDIRQWTSVCEQQIGPACPPALKARIISDLERFPIRLLQHEAEALLQWDALGALQACKVPTLYVQGVTPFSETLFRASCPQVRIEKIEVAGHYSTLEAPQAVNALLEQFLTLL